MMDYTAIVVALIALIGQLYNSYKTNQNTKKNDIKKQVDFIEHKMTQVSMSQVFLLQDRLLHLCTKYLDAGELGLDELKSLTNLYNSYHTLGGNDFITELFERVKELPIKK